MFFPGFEIILGVHLEGHVVESDSWVPKGFDFGGRSRFRKMGKEGDLVMEIAASHEADSPEAVGIVAGLVAVGYLKAHHVAVEYHRLVEVADLDADVLDSPNGRGIGLIWGSPDKRLSRLRGGFRPPPLYEEGGSQKEDA
jgi:hypothetical protein